jgi:hypothetical protein|tara:strand:- start:557 stop:1240 length:684 start_codon:yes stop_codon:yes gene_type:complete
MVFPFPTICPALGVTELAFVTSATSTQHNGSIAMPSGIQAGDIIIVGQQWRGQENNTADYPGSGFTSISNLYNAGGSLVNDDYYKSHTSYKIATGSEAGASISGFADQGAYTYNSAGIYIYRPNAEATAVTQVNKYTYQGNGNPAQNILYGSTSGAATIALAVAGCNNYPGITFTGATPDASINLNNAGSDLRMRAYGANKGSGVDITTDMSDDGANLFTSVLLEIT